MSHMQSGDAGMRAESSNLGIQKGVLMRIVGITVWMVLLQGVLLILHRSRTSRPRNTQPQQAEICVGIIIVWAFQIGFSQMLAAIWSILSFGLSEFEANGQWGEGSDQDIRIWVGAVGFGWVWNGIVRLFHRVLITWYFHLGIIFLLDTGIPLCKELRRDPHRALRKIESRSKEILDFLDSTFQDPFSDVSLLPRASSEDILKCSNQAIYLERQQTDYPNEGQRILSWNIVVNKDALDEMKETLGPPGGFGELGFNVTSDGVRFEAMGVRTSLNLIFKLREIDDNCKAKETRGRKKHK